MIKRTIITSIIFSSSAILLNFLLFISDIYQPRGYIRWVNPFGIFLFTYWFFLAATIIYVIMKEKRNINKWISSTISILSIYFIVSMPTILEGDYLKYLEWWKTFLSLTVLILLLVILDEFVKKLILNKKNS